VIFPFWESIPLRRNHPIGNLGQDLRRVLIGCHWFSHSRIVRNVVLILVMNGILQLQSRWSRKKLVSVYATLLVAMSGAGDAVLRYKHTTHNPGVAPAITHVARSNEPEAPALTIDRVIQHGHIVEIQARVSPGTTVMVNGQQAAVIWGDGEIKHFVGPLPDGISEIAITVQDDTGGINSQQISVSLP